MELDHTPSPESFPELALDLEIGAQEELVMITLSALAAGQLQMKGEVKMLREKGADLNPILMARRRAAIEFLSGVEIGRAPSANGGRTDHQSLFFFFGLP